MFQKSQKRVYVKAKPAAHIYTFAIAWLFWSSVGDVSPDIYSILTLLVLSWVPSSIVYFIIRKKKDRPTDDILISELVKSGNEDGKVIVEALEQIEAVQVENAKISNKDVLNEVNEIIQVSREILGKVTKKPELLSSIQRFLSHYLPMLVNFLADYHYMESLSVKGENVRASMQKIEHALKMLNDAFKKQLDSLFSSSAMNLEVDMDVLENILKKDGLIDGGLMSMSRKKENE